MKDRRNLLLLAASLLVGVALFEVGVRLLRIDYNLTPNWRYHPVLGWSQVPGGNYLGTIDGRNFTVSFNAMGFRDVEHQLAKPAGVKRIVVIGDSFCEAVQVNLEETFHKRLEQLLNERGPDRWEVINLGVGDFGPAQAYIALLEYGLAFDPDLVIQQIFPLNDICNNSIGLHGLCRSNNDRYRPYFVEDGAALRQTSSQPIRTWLRRNVVTYHVVEYWIMRVFGPDPQNPSSPLRGFRLFWRGFRGVDPLLATFVGADSQPAAVAAGWRMTERLIARVVDTTRSRGIAYLGLVAPFELQLTARWDTIAQRLPPPRMIRDYPERRLDSLYQRLGVPSVLLLDAFQPYVDEVLPYVGGHLNIPGHRRAAEALYHTMVASGLAGPQNARARTGR